MQEMGSRSGVKCRHMGLARPSVHSKVCALREHPVFIVVEVAAAIDPQVAELKLKLSIEGKEETKQVQKKKSKLHAAADALSLARQFYSELKKLGHLHLRIHKRGI